MAEFTFPFDKLRGLGGVGVGVPEEVGVEVGAGLGVGVGIEGSALFDVFGEGEVDTTAISSSSSSINSPG